MPALTVLLALWGCISNSKHFDSSQGGCKRIESSHTWHSVTLLRLGVAAGLPSYLRSASGFLGVCLDHCDACVVFPVKKQNNTSWVHCGEEVVSLLAADPWMRPAEMAEAGGTIHNVLFAQPLWTTSHRPACSLKSRVFSWWDASLISGGLLSPCRLFLRQKNF